MLSSSILTLSAHATNKFPNIIYHIGSKSQDHASFAGRHEACCLSHGDPPQGITFLSRGRHRLWAQVLVSLYGKKESRSPCGI
jgi:hypothetical protein